jgi:hypothetical protein
MTWTTGRPKRSAWVCTSSLRAGDPRGQGGQDDGLVGPGVGEELLLYGEKGGDVPRLGCLGLLLRLLPHLVLLVDPPGRGHGGHQEGEAGLGVLFPDLPKLGRQLGAFGRAVGHHQVLSRGRLLGPQEARAAPPGRALGHICFFGLVTMCFRRPPLRPLRGGIFCIPLYILATRGIL